MVCLNRSEHKETNSNQARSGLSSPEIGKPVWESILFLFFTSFPSIPYGTVWFIQIILIILNKLVLKGNKCTASCKSVILGEDCSSCTICPTLQQQHYHLTHTAATALPSVPHCSNSTTISPTLQQHYYLSHTAATALPSVPHCSNSSAICPTLQQQLCRLSHTAPTALPSVPHCSNSTTICPTLHQQHYHLSHTAATALPCPTLHQQHYHLSCTASTALPSVPHCNNSTAGTLLWRMTYLYIIHEWPMCSPEITASFILSVLLLVQE